jgi:hypothetical protein
MSGLRPHMLTTGLIAGALLLVGCSPDERDLPLVEEPPPAAAPSPGPAPAMPETGGWERRAGPEGTDTAARPPAAAPSRRPAAAAPETGGWERRTEPPQVPDTASPAPPVPEAGGQEGGAARPPP